MAEIIRIKDSTFSNQQKHSSCNSLTPIIIVKLIGDFDKLKLTIIKNHIDNLIDEPVLFVIKDKDRKTKELLTLLNYPYEVLSLNQIKRINKNKCFALFIVGDFKYKIQKIMEIVCDKKFLKSILLV